MKPLDIIEQNLTKEEFVAYLRGSILMFLLSERPLVLSEFKLYANKLVEVVKSPLVGSACSDEQEPQERPQMEPTVDPDEPRVYKFKLGDHVIVSKGTKDERAGVIVRLPMDGVDCRTSYVVDLDDKNLGWKATVAVDGVDCKNAWVAGTKNMELLGENTLVANKWYHTTDFTVEELQALLPKGTTIETEKEVLYDGIETTPPTKTTIAVVNGITTSLFGDKTLIEAATHSFNKEWFKLVEESK